RPYAWRSTLRPSPSMIPLSRSWAKCSSKASSGWACSWCEASISRSARRSTSATMRSFAVARSMAAPYSDDHGEGVGLDAQRQRPGPVGDPRTVEPHGAPGLEVELGGGDLALGDAGVRDVPPLG